MKHFSLIGVKFRYNCPCFTSFIIVNKVLVNRLTGEGNIPDFSMLGLYNFIIEPEISSTEEALVQSGESSDH